MKVIQRELFDLSRSDEITLIPLYDIQLGSIAVDEKLFEKVVRRIANEPNTFWVGGGDYLDAINRRDNRFDPSILPDWITQTKGGISDIVGKQRDRFLDYVSPIAHKCWALLYGNHEGTIMKWYERDIYGEIVKHIKQVGGIKQDIELGYSGYLQLKAYRSSTEQRNGCRTININMHHGFGGGKMAGGKALNAQRWAWTRNADLLLLGHTHNMAAQVEAVEQINSTGQVGLHYRRIAYCGTFLRTVEEGITTYSERSGYLPLPIGGCEITLRPGAEHQMDLVRITI